MRFLIRLAKGKGPNCKVIAVSTAQEEIGTRGAISSAHLANPDVALVVDVSHATDHPDADHRKYGRFSLGGGPILTLDRMFTPGFLKDLWTVLRKKALMSKLRLTPGRLVLMLGDSSSQRWNSLLV